MGPKHRLLLLDANIPDMAAKLVAACRSFEVTASSRPRETLQRFCFSEIQPDIIVLDVNFQAIASEVARDFPGQDPQVLGVYLLEALRQMDPDIPIVILTDAASLAPAFSGAHHRATAFYTKDEALEAGGLLDTRLCALVDSAHYRYDRDQQQLAEEIASSYRREEARAPGTVAYWKFEEQKLIETVRLIERAEVEVLDIGVGDGRNPELLFRALPDRVRITGVDFSGKMLDQCRKGVLRRYWEDKRLRLERGAAEHLSFPDDSFDLVIAGFGFLSYSAAADVLSTIRRVAKPNAYVLLGSYNVDALFYDLWKDPAQAVSAPISGRVDRDLGILYVNEERTQTISVRPASIHQMVRLVRHHGFSIDALWTFPTLYSILDRAASKRRSTEPFESSKYHGCADFNPELYEQDVEYSASLDRTGDHKGYYTLLRCRPVPQPALTAEPRRTIRRKVLDLSAFFERAEEELERALRYNRPLALLSVDLETDPAERKSAAQMLSESLRAPDRVCSDDCDQILMLLTETLPEDAKLTAERVLRLLEPIAKARIGIAVWPDDGLDVTALLASARAAANSTDPSPRALRST